MLGGGQLHVHVLVPGLLAAGAGVSPSDASWLASLVLSGAAIGCLASGFVNDWLGRISNYHPARFQIYGFAGTAASALACWRVCNARVALATSLWAAVAFAFAISQQATFWAITTEIGGKHLGAIFGLMNSMGVPGAFASTMFLGRFVDEMGAARPRGRAQWDPAFYVYAGVLLVGACCWLAVDARHDSG